MHLDRLVKIGHFLILILIWSISFILLVHVGNSHLVVEVEHSEDYDDESVSVVVKTPYLKNYILVLEVLTLTILITFIFDALKMCTNEEELEEIEVEQVDDLNYKLMV